MFISDTADLVSCVLVFLRFWIRTSLFLCLSTVYFSCLLQWYDLPTFFRHFTLANGLLLFLSNLNISKYTLPLSLPFRGDVSTIEAIVTRFPTPFVYFSIPRCCSCRVRSNETKTRSFTSINAARKLNLCSAAAIFKTKVQSYCDICDVIIYWKCSQLFLISTRTKRR